MKVTMLVLNNFTHDARVHKEAKSLASVGHDVTVVALYEEGLQERESQSGYKIIRIVLKAKIWRSGTIVSLLKYLEYTFKLYLLLLDAHTDVIHAHNANTLLAAWLVSRLLKTKLVYDAHEFETGRHFGDSNLSRIIQHFWSVPEKLIISKTDAVITVNQSIGIELVRIYDISMPIIVMNTPNYKQVEKTDLLREKLNIPSNKKIVLYQGRIVSGRGIELVLLAIQRLDNVVAVLLGDGPLLDKLREDIDTGRIERVYLPGRVPLELLGSYTISADLGVVFIEDICLNHHYALPNKLFEYIHAGLPVIASDLPEITRIVHQYQIGEVISTSDPSELAEVISGIINDPKRYSEYVANTKRASKDFVWRHEGSKILQLYQDLRI
jgi:glycosyltransferase involved in cell wall biosynthesis